MKKRMRLGIFKKTLSREQKINLLRNKVRKETEKFIKEQRNIKKMVEKHDGHFTIEILRSIGVKV